MTYTAPVKEILYTFRSILNFSDQCEDRVYEGLDLHTIETILYEAGRFGSEVLAPLNRSGDRSGSILEEGVVRTPGNWKEAYRQFVDNGWSSLPCPEEYGGQGLPSVISSAVSEIWNGANLSFGLCPLLTQGAIDTILIGGSDEIKKRYLPHLVSGKWTGTMDITEPQAGSDLSDLRTVAFPQEDDSYRIVGTKAFITYGDHELSENIIHLVLARLPDAPAGTRGISLFVVPKYIVQSRDGSLGPRNDVVCIGLENKLGIHASPTCLMSFGEKEGAIGELVGQKHRGLMTMFIMMNAARLAVGIQGVALSHGATQLAIEYAKERRQGRAQASTSGGMVPIIEHPDVRRTLLTMKSLTQGCRAICLMTAREIDRSCRAKSIAEREKSKALTALLIPVAKAFSADISCEIASMGIQVHGGTGFIEESGAAQYYRDARILPIYEGTNGIQALDLVMRKLPFSGGSVVEEYFSDLQKTVDFFKKVSDPILKRSGRKLEEGLRILVETTRWLEIRLEENPEMAMAGATPYLRLFGIVSAGCFLAKGVAFDLDNEEKDLEQVGLAKFFIDNVVCGASSLSQAVMYGSDAIIDRSIEIA